MIRNRSIVSCILLSIITCGIYGWYWLACLANDVNTASGRTNETSGGMVVLLSIITCNIYHIYWMYKAGEKIDQARQMRGLPSQNNGLVYLFENVHLCLCLSPHSPAYLRGVSTTMPTNSGNLTNEDERLLQTAWGKRKRP